MVRIFVRTDRRVASVGCAVNTGRTWTRHTVWVRSSWPRPAARMASIVPSSEISSWAIDSSRRWTCSATFARWK